MANGPTAVSRWVEVDPDRITGWLDSFAARHQGARSDVSPDQVIVYGADGAVAECHPPFPPLAPDSGGSGPELAAHATAGRTVAVLLVRLGGYAAGVFAGPDADLVASKVGSRLVHGRSAAGGTSQHRFARRREKQVNEALSAAADCAVAVFAPHAAALDAVVLGGDKRAIAGLADDPRLRPYFALAVDRFLTVPDPRLNVLRETPRAFRAIRIRLTDASLP